MKSVYIIIICCLFISCNSGRYFEKGETEYNSKNYKKALRHFNRAIVLNKNEWQYYLYRGHTYKAMDLNIIGIEDYKKAIEITNGSNLIPIHDLGSSYNDIGEHKKAIECYKKALSIDSSLYYIYTNLGFAYSNIGEDSMALVCFQKSIKLNPKNTEAYIKRASFYYSRSLFDSGDKDYKTAVELNPGNPRVYNSIGYNKMITGKYEEAITYFNKTIELNPLHAYAYNNRGYCNYKLATQEEQVNEILLKKSLDDINKSLKLSKGNAHGYKNRALILFEQRKEKQGCRQMKKAMKLKFRKEDEKEFLKILETHCR